jgi:hypothetical protein
MQRLINEFCYRVYNQLELLIYLDLMIKNKEIRIYLKRYFKCTSTKLV